MLIGVDVGGSKTDFVLATPQGAIVATHRAGAGNWEGIGIDAAARLYRDGVAQLLAASCVSANAVHACGWGLAGLDWPSDAVRLATIIHPILPHATHVLRNDAEIALRAGSRYSYGVGAIAGTGSTVVARGRAQQEARTYGLGADWGDFDGAQGLGRAALRAAAHAQYGVDTPTSLSAALCAWANVASIPALAEAMSRGQATPDIATFAPIVMEHAAAGDAIARRIVVDAAVTLGHNIAAMARRVDLQAADFDVVLAGGVATSGSRVFLDTIALVVTPMCPLARFTVLDTPPVYGALLCAADACTIPLTRTEITMPA